jgi:peptidoglycan L-alanyl-D-glutamate endopeptidase CwlK
MISSRNTHDLLPVVEGKALLMFGKCKAAGVDLLFTATYRDAESQDALYAVGRFGDQNRIVTNAKGGDSFHQYKCAFDVVPLVNGKPYWTLTDSKGILTPIWKTVGDIGVAVGLEWAFNWKSFKEGAHFQYTGGLTLNDLKAGKVIK